MTNSIKLFATSVRSRLAAVLLVATLAPHALPAQTAVTEWLVLGPIPATAPFGAAASDSALLDATRLRIDDRWPASGDVVSLPNATAARWRTGDAQVPAGNVVHAVAYVESDRWQRTTLTLPAADGETRRIWVDGKRVSGTSVELGAGKHIVHVQRLARGDARGALSATIAAAAGGVLAVSIDPRHPATWRELHGVASLGGVTLDEAGTRAAYMVRRSDYENDRAGASLEVREVASGRLLWSRGSGNPAGATWGRGGRQLAFLTTTDRTDNAGGRDLWIWDGATGNERRVMRGEAVNTIVGWSGDGEWIYFTGRDRVRTPAPPRAGEMTRLTEVWERGGGGAPDKVHLFAVHTTQGTRVTLVGDSAVGVSGAALSPDGKSIVFSRSVPTNERRPWLRAELWVLDVASLATRKVLDLQKEAFSAPGAFAWSPDSRAVAFCASAKELQQEESPTFSVYENELYATSIDRPALVHLSDGYVPSVGGGLGCSRITWNARDGRIYVPVDAGARTLPARTARSVTSAVEKTTLETMTLPFEVMPSFDIAGTTMVAAVENPVTPASLQRIDMTTGRATPLHDPNAGVLDQVTLPAWRPWSFRNSRGEEIESWYWLPPGFDASRRYPMIVHYYGGTLAMKKNFEQRLVWFASNGYVVLMMNPAGAPGYGQKFSDYHANDWGFPAASDIIEGTQEFLKANAYVDPARVGNFGHSYGGFMTMHLLTRTTIFRTGISLAGISNIANYWGAGNSGYSYTDGTCPGCYPWNRKDVYVDRSPLFQADRIQSPLLLIHGTVDDNVVPTESEQMFTALRMLGRETELIRVYGENHGIGSRPSIAANRDAIMLDWFEKYLRDRAEGWGARWKR